MLKNEDEYETALHSVYYQKDQLDTNADEKKISTNRYNTYTTTNNKSRKNQSNTPKCNYYSTSTKTKKL